MDQILAMGEYCAMESLRSALNNIKNSKVVSDYQDPTKYPKMPSAKEMIAAHRSKANVHNVNVTLDGSLSDFETPKGIEMTEKLIGLTGAVQKAFIDHLMKEKGKEGSRESWIPESTNFRSGMTCIGVRVYYWKEHNLFDASYTFYHPAFGDHIATLEDCTDGQGRLARGENALRYTLDG